MIPANTIKIDLCDELCKEIEIYYGGKQIVDTSISEFLINCCSAYLAVVQNTVIVVKVIINKGIN